ncbi:LOW QUALITY PROTEIN: tudor domain-containing 6-like [Anomaloglossus baeobatrachus]
MFDFYVQVAEDKRLDEISDILINKMSSSESEDLRDEEDASLRNIICAYFPEDGLYYRGMVKGTPKEGLSIEYISYGNVSLISNCKNYRLPQKCLPITIMSTRCAINKSEASSAPNLAEMLAEFSKRTSNILLDCEFVKKNGLKWDVIPKDELDCINDLLNEEEKNIKEVNRMLMKIKTAREDISVQHFAWNLVLKAKQLRTSLAGGDRHLQKNMIGDDVYPRHGEEQESETDEFKADITDLSSD